MSHWVVALPAYEFLAASSFASAWLAELIAIPVLITSEIVNGSVRNLVTVAALFLAF